MTYTWKDIFKKSKPHFSGEGRQSSFIFGDYCLSIVGGRQGLYGNFFDTFEVAVIHKDTGSFVTSDVLNDEFFKGSKDDIIPYTDMDTVVKIINLMSEKYGK